MSNTGAGERAEGGLPTSNGKIPDARMIDEINRLYDELGRVPSVTDMRKHGEYSISPFKRRWGSWPNAVDAAGLDPEKAQDSPSFDAQLDVVYDIICECVERGETDAAGGGVASKTVAEADEIDVEQSTVGDRLRYLYGQGRVKRVRGIGPDGPRMSYLPADEDDEDDEDDDDDRGVPIARY